MMAHDKRQFRGRRAVCMCIQLVRFREALQECYMNRGRNHVMRVCMACSGTAVGQWLERRAVDMKSAAGERA